MSLSKNILASGVIVIEALLLLFPATLFYLAGMVFSVLGFFGANKSGVTPAFLAVVAFLLLPGYGLYSLWWLVVKHRKISRQDIPRYIWGGVVVGGVVALIFLSPYVISGFIPPTPVISHSEMSHSGDYCYFNPV